MVAARNGATTTRPGTATSAQSAKNSATMSQTNSNLPACTSGSAISSDRMTYGGTNSTVKYSVFQNGPRLGVLVSNLA